MRPHKLVIAGHPFSVSYVENLYGDDGEELTGRMQLASNKITVLASNESSEYNQRDSLLHEVIHAELAIAGYTGKKKDDNEPMVNALATLLLDTLRRNPSLVTYLTEEVVT